MSMAGAGVDKFRVEMDEEEYRLVGPGGETGQETEYGDVAWLRVGAAVYYTAIDDPNNTVPVVHRVDSVTEMDTEVEDVVFGDGEEEEREVDEDEEEEEEEEEDEDEDEAAVEAVEREEDEEEDEEVAEV